MNRYLLFLFLPLCAFSSESALDASSTDDVVRAIVEAPIVTVNRISPNGHWIVYSVSRPSIAENLSSWLDHINDELWLRGVGSHHAPVKLPADVTAARWRPGFELLSFIQPSAGLTLYDPSSGISRPVKIRQSGPDAIAVPDDYVWSPQGHFMAFTTALTAASKPNGLDPRRGVPFDTFKPQKSDAFSRLYVLDLSTGSLTALTLEPLRIQSIVWSPDESQLALVVDRESDSQTTAYDLVVVNRESGALRELVTQPGRDTAPLWSPDGRWIAFSTQFGEPNYIGSWPAVMPANGGEVVRFAGAPSGTPFRWNTDSRHLLIGSPRELGTGLLLADVETRRIVSQVPLPAGDVTMPYDTNRSVSEDGHYMSFIRSNPSTPPEVYFTRLDAKGFPQGSTRKLTSLSSGFPVRKLVRTELVAWPSQDEKFTIHGLLITPVDAWNGTTLKQSLPTLLSVRGGPSMVTRDFAGDGWKGLELAAAQHGYAVLVPNTRGREGYGDDFLFGIRDAKSYVGVPYEDAIAGVDYLVDRGVSDPGKLAIGGHSYGGTFAEYAITRTNRFRAALVHEAGSADLLDYLYPSPVGSWQALLARDLYGVDDPLDPLEQASIFAQSAGLNGRYIKTPTLLHFAAGNDVGPKFFTVLQRYEVPSELYLYDELHVFQRPAAVADDIVRSLRWLDRWVRNLPPSERFH